MSTAKLNLARKWRSQNFDEVVGQELAVRMLKNSLYLDHYFPVYLFSGQRGCGKTTAARIFAAAANCQNLLEFQKKPSFRLPCSNCSSCQAMQKGNHPDFIEIDAASHTGVDNVRQIIDAASLLPLLGRKKIYLIDEAHMLSKAAFNAFLKILEEPPETVFFILATTDPHKIIDTVVSRCFRVLFTAVQTTPLCAHLEHVCEQEGIAYEREALQTIVSQTEGSVRDALNLLEQVRFSNCTVDQKAVLSVLGRLEQRELAALCKKALDGNVQVLLQHMQAIDLGAFAAPTLWNALIETIRLAIKAKHGVGKADAETIGQLIHYRIGQLSACLHIFYEYELIFLKTRAQHTVLEQVFLKICMANAKDGEPEKKLISAMESGNQNVAAQPSQTSEESTKDQALPTGTQLSPEDKKKWQTFLENIDALADPLLASMFKQYSSMHYKAGSIKLSFHKSFSFFDELLANTAKAWKDPLKNSFGNTVQLVATFDAAEKKEMSKGKRASQAPTNERVKQAATGKAEEARTPAATAKRYEGRHPYGRYQTRSTSGRNTEKKIDVSDAALWPKTNLILKFFPGVVTEVVGNDHD